MVSSHKRESSLRAFPRPAQKSVNTKLHQCGAPSKSILLQKQALVHLEAWDAQATTEEPLLKEHRPSRVDVMLLRFADTQTPSSNIFKPTRVCCRIAAHEVWKQVFDNVHIHIMQFTAASHFVWQMQVN